MNEKKPLRKVSIQEARHAAIKALEDAEERRKREREDDDRVKVIVAIHPKRRSGQG